MSIPQLVELREHWKRYPPVHILKALQLGLGKPLESPKKASDFVSDFQSQMGGGGAVIKSGG